jgi:recombination protein RecA
MTNIIKDPMDSVLANIEKQMGNKGKASTFARFGNITSTNEPVISFGLPAVDDASYCGGVPRSKMIEIFGPESSGKSLLTLYLIASAQRQGLECALIDIEQSFDPYWAAQHGVNVEKLVYSNDFDSGEQALEYAYQLCKCGSFGLVVIDSTAALVPKSELEGTLEDNARVGAQAQLLSRGCRKIKKATGEGSTTCVFVNQIRMKIGVVYGNPETTPGGQALKFYSDQRICTRSKSKIKIKEGDKEIIVGQVSSVTFVKNKTARPFGSAEFKIIFDSASLNPVVMLCNALKADKMIKTYKGLFNISKGVLGKDKIETSATTLIELADYLVKNNLVITLLDKLIESIENDPTANSLDEAILEMKEDPSKIVSPSQVTIDVSKIADAKVEDIDPEDLEDSEPED